MAINKRIIKSNDEGGGVVCTNDYDPFDGNGVALYQLNGNALDSSPNNYDGSVSGGTFENNGVFGQCWDTTGTADEYITATQPPNVKTVSAWVRVSGTHSNSVGAIVWSNGGSEPSVSYFLGIEVTGKIYAFATYLDALSRTINLNQWYHIASTLEGTTVKIYFEGALVETRTTAYPEIVNGSQITMGRSNYVGNVHNLHGSIDQVRFFNTALTALEIEALYLEEIC